MNDDSKYIFYGSQIEQIKAEVRHYRETLNNEAIWLFLATLGCWGVTNKPMQYCAFAIVVILFGRITASKLQDNLPFKDKIKKLESEVNDTVQVDVTRKALLYELDALKGMMRINLAIIRDAWPFLLCWMFYGVSFVLVLVP